MPLFSFHPSLARGALDTEPLMVVEIVGCVARFKDSSNSLRLYISLPSAQIRNSKAYFLPFPEVNDNVHVSWGRLKVFFEERRNLSRVSFSLRNLCSWLRWVIVVGRPTRVSRFSTNTPSGTGVYRRLLEPQTQNVLFALSGTEMLYMWCSLYFNVKANTGHRAIVHPRVGSILHHARFLCELLCE